MVHGEEETSKSFAKHISSEFGFASHVPAWGEIIDLDTMQSEFASYGVPLKKNFPLLMAR